MSKKDLTEQEIHICYITGSPQPDRATRGEGEFADHTLCYECQARLEYQFPRDMGPSIFDQSGRLPAMAHG